jgi:diguanylate cyclase (GGDEF)-like protein
LWLLVDYTLSHTYSNGLIPIWNTCVRLRFFLVTCSLLVELKSRFEYEAALVKTDGLTGISNARSFKELVGHYLEHAARHRHPVVLGYIDVDNFKTISDSFGYSEGAHILKTVAITLALCVRTTDVVGKLGGDEFAIFLPETDCAGARVMFGRIHENWRKLRRTGAGRSVSASVSPCSSQSPVTSTKPSRLPTD